MTNFEKALAFTLSVEGGFVDNPDDPGGATKWGVTQKVYDRYCNETEAGLGPVKLMRRVDMQAIYQDDYWSYGGCGLMPTVAASMILFDSVVNHGVRRGVQLLQRTVKVKEDGDIGPITRAAVAMGGFEMDFLWVRLQFYTRIRHGGPFLKGWVNRMLKLRAAIKEL